MAEADEVEVVFLSPPWGGLDYLNLGEGEAGPAGAEAGVVAGGDAQAEARRRRKVPYPLKALAPLPGDELFALSRAVTPHVAYYLPRNVDVAEVAELPRRYPRRDKDRDEEAEERVGVEEEWMGGKLKAVTVYYGDLAGGAEVEEASS